jgi:hypothetical protein
MPRIGTPTVEQTIAARIKKNQEALKAYAQAYDTAIATIDRAYADYFAELEEDQAQPKDNSSTEIVAEPR